MTVTRNFNADCAQSRQLVVSSENRRSCTVVKRYFYSASNHLSCGLAGGLVGYLAEEATAFNGGLATCRYVSYGSGSEGN